jgi:hypothetical protein
MSRPVVAALIATVVAFAALTAPASAQTAPPDGAYGVFAGGNVTGDVIVHYTGTTTVNAGVLGLVAGREYVLIGRSIGCGGSPSSANRSFKATASADANGALFFRANVAIARNVDSFWLGSNDALGVVACAKARNYLGNLQDADDYNGDGALGLVKTGPGTLAAIAVVTKRSSGKARLALALTGLEPDHNYSVRGATGECGKAIGNVRFMRTIYRPSPGAWFLKATVDLRQEQLDSLRSIRIRDTTTHFVWDCVPMVIMANTEGDFH